VLSNQGWFFKEQESDIVMKTAFVELLMNSQILNIVIGVWEKFVFGLRVPFAGAIKNNF
jgi:hypothetical protein